MNLSYLPAMYDGATLPGPDPDGLNYCQPGPAMATAQLQARRIADPADDTGPAIAAVVVVNPVPEGWAICCPECFRAKGSQHHCDGRTSEVVQAFDSVWRPGEQVIG